MVPLNTKSPENSGHSITVTARGAGKRQAPGTRATSYSIPIPWSGQRAKSWCAVTRYRRRSDLPPYSAGTAAARCHAWRWSEISLLFPRVRSIRAPTSSQPPGFSMRRRPHGPAKQGKFLLGTNIHKNPDRYLYALPASAINVSPRLTIRES